ncbi:MFS transporter [Staphylococcus ureilyticus]|uniref:Quinolone resistance protein NorB n=1 Tax=Staphylococcus ureilyticus TaxID=94138 RepID=A0AB34AMY1_STAUR|nr:MFS transporter [Staphylococcus ureilyticus]AVL77346.1 MFS transporter [Staphylococcus cohnii]MCT1914610.1 MFS transporter [Staphylococcus ureilyticus]MDT3983322.1 MFS transporter [Staphylococcus ureilyticus]OJT33957.1 MFS transporter [Staphylococcus ureilyticus]PNZ42544.1 MFS transporter [Staphylococcus ureilyticus]
MTVKIEKVSGSKLLTGIVLSILTYWLFAQAFLNIGPKIQTTFDASPDIVNISVSLTSFVTGVFMVVAGNISDKFGKVKLTRIALVLSIVGSLMLIASGNVVMLLLGRIVQGLSAAIIMPATISIVNDFFDGDDRQKALSFWSIGAFGGTGLSSFFAGALATFIFWQSIFILSIILSIVALVLLRKLPESRINKAETSPFDYIGLIIFIIMIGSISFVITQGYKIGWLNAVTVILFVIFLICIYIFFKVERVKKVPFIDLDLFKNRPYIGAVLANFLLNTGVGVIALLNMYVQSGLKLTAFQAGLLTLPYLISLLLVIRLGEKSIKRFGAKRAMIIGPIFTGLGVLMFSLTFFDTTLYIVVALIGAICFGGGTGLFATPALSTAVSTTPPEKVGVASGIFKMGSTLGGAFGIAIMTSIFTGIIQSGQSIHIAAGVGFIMGTCLVLCGVLASALVIPTRKVSQ